MWIFHDKGFDIFRQSFFFFNDENYESVENIITNVDFFWKTSFVKLFRHIICFEYVWQNVDIFQHFFCHTSYMHINKKTSHYLSWTCMTNFYIFRHFFLMSKVWFPLNSYQLKDTVCIVSKLHDTMNIIWWYV